jgi:tripartite-type tricarboxylate transporter receptor subunit TctC
MVFIRTVVAFCLAAASLAASAQAFPTKPVTMIVPFTPGGSVDAVARQVAASLGPYLGQNVLVENKVGAGGTIGSGIAANAAPDGYTILLGTTSARPPSRDGRSIAKPMLILWRTILNSSLPCSS